MDGLELRQTLMQSLALGMKTMAEERKMTNSGPYHDELVGRMDATRTMLEFLLNADVTPSECAVCAQAGQAMKDPGPPVDGDSSIEEGEAQ